MTFIVHFSWKEQHRLCVITCTNPLDGESREHVPSYAGVMTGLTRVNSLVLVHFVVVVYSSFLTQIVEQMRKQTPAEETINVLLCCFSPFRLLSIFIAIDHIFPRSFSFRSPDSLSTYWWWLATVTLSLREMLVRYKPHTTVVSHSLNVLEKCLTEIK